MLRPEAQLDKELEMLSRSLLTHFLLSLAVEMAKLAGIGWGLEGASEGLEKLWMWRVNKKGNFMRFQTKWRRNLVCWVKGSSYGMHISQDPVGTSLWLESSTEHFSVYISVKHWSWLTVCSTTLMFFHPPGACKLYYLTFWCDTRPAGWSSEAQLYKWWFLRHD